jgi:hypothetical protein
MEHRPPTSPTSIGPFSREGLERVIRTIDFRAYFSDTIDAQTHWFGRLDFFVRKTFVYGTCPADGRLRASERKEPDFRGLEVEGSGEPPYR